MSDFVQTMKDWRRLCCAMGMEYPGNWCDHCPLLCISPDERGCDAIYADEFADNVDWNKLEQIVKKWAAEHSMVYPTWGEWLIKQGVLKAGTTTMHGITWQPVGDNLFEPIPANIAEKLGLKSII